jgi:glycosyltransferase involved in cell wall biosynthesis/ribosomal protein S18 acetylase RimI-like enzyme
VGAGIVTTPHIAHVTTTDVTLRYLLLDQLRALRDAGMRVTAISAPGAWAKELEDEGITFMPWPHATRAWDPLADARAFGELIRIFRRERFDLVHTHNPKPGVMGRIAARLAGIPCVVNTVHGLYATREDRPARRLPVLALERFAARFSDLELYQSEEDRAWAHRIPSIDRKAVHLGNGCDLSRFDPQLVSGERRSEVRRELGLPDGAVVVGIVARMVREKGFLELFEAAGTVGRAHPEARFLVVGDPDPEKADSLTPAEVDAAGPHVVFAGWRNDLPDVLAAMDLFVLPSWREGVPRSAIEAAAMGLPLVLTDIRGCREIVRDGQEGLLVPPRDPGRLAEAIGALVREPEERARMGKAAHARARDRFDGLEVARKVVVHTGTLLGRHGLRDDSSASPVLRVRRMRKGDAEGIARLHRESMPEAFLPSLGEGFLRQLYRALSVDGNAAAHVAEAGGRVVGFAAGVGSVPRFYRRFLLRRGFLAAVMAIPSLVRPTVLRRIRETAAYPSGPSSLAGTDAELLAIAVLEQYRGGGVGAELASRVLRDLFAEGAERVRVVVGADNEGANRLYDRLGFDHTGTLSVHEGITSNLWVTGCPS